jgi:hypothetical protein
LVCSEKCKEKHNEDYRSKPKLTVYSRVTGYCTPHLFMEQRQIKRISRQAKIFFRRIEEGWQMKCSVCYNELSDGQGFLSNVNSDGKGLGVGEDPIAVCSEGCKKKI